jgi:hypothetical protein
MFSLLNVFEQIAIVILDPFNLILDSVEIVFSIETDRLHEMFRHLSFVVVINSILMRVAIIE